MREHLYIELLEAVADAIDIWIAGMKGVSSRIRLMLPLIRRVP